MKRKPFAIAGLSLVALLGAGWLAAPWAAKKYIEREHPDIKVGKVTKIRLDHVEFDSVSVTREPWLKANFDRVVYRKGGAVEAVGGEVVYSHHLAPKGGDTAASGGRAITIIGLRKLQVVGSNYGALLEGVRYSQGELCFDKAAFTHPKLSGEAEKGCVWKAKQEAYAETVKAHVKVPLGIPEFPDEGDIVIDKTHIWFDKAEPAANAYHVTYGPAQATVVTVSREGASTRLKVGELVLSHPWLSKGEVYLQRGLDVLVPDLALTQTLTPIKINVNGLPLSIFVKERAVESESTRCEDWVKALPPTLAGPFEGIRWKDIPGRNNGLHVWIMAGGDKPEFKIWHTCKADCSSPALKALRRKFTYQPYSAKDVRFDRESGPGSLDWVYLGDMHQSMPMAAEICEDPGFKLHQGYIAQAFENSLKDNLKLGRFMRGGSTITMQLAKNLWLYRDKTVTRKLQEVLLAIALESCFTKGEIMELYLNVVEYGPDLYGIGPAVRKYFDAAPVNLNPEQSFWLAMLLPRPRKAGLPNEAAMKRVTGFMKLLVKNKRLDEGMLAPDAPPPGSDAEWGQ